MKKIEPSAAPASPTPPLETDVDRDAKKPGWKSCPSCGEYYAPGVACDLGCSPKPNVSSSIRVQNGRFTMMVGSCEIPYTLSREDVKQLVCGILLLDRKVREDIITWLK